MIAFARSIGSARSLVYREEARSSVCRGCYLLITGECLRDTRASFTEPRAAAYERVAWPGVFIFFFLLASRLLAVSRGYTC